VTQSSHVRSHIAYGVTIFFVGVVLVWALYLVRQVLLLLYIAGLLAIGFSPVVRWIERSNTDRRRRRQLPRWAAILVLYVIVIGAIAAALALILPPLISQSRDLSANLPTYVDDLQQWLLRYDLISHQYTWSEVLHSVPSSAGTASTAVAGVLGALQSVIGAIGAILTILVLPYYLLLEAGSLRSALLHLFAADRRTQIARVSTNVTVKVSAWLGGQLLLGGIIGVTAGVGLWLIGVPYFYVLALVCAVGEMIPVVGPVFAAVPAVLIAATVSVHTGLFTVLYFIVQQFIENHFLVPRVMQRQVGVSAVTVIASLLIGSELLGIVGALLAVPTAAITQVFVQEYVDHNGD
jgi:predicted PurR-regulated permease PerM